MGNCGLGDRGIVMAGGGALLRGLDNSDEIVQVEVASVMFTKFWSIMAQNFLLLEKMEELIKRITVI